MNSALLLALVLQASTPSKLGGFFIEASTPGSQTFLNACPRVAVFLLPSPTAPSYITQLRTACPPPSAPNAAGTSVVAHYDSTGSSYKVTDDPKVDAGDVWGLIEGALTNLLPTQVDWVEGPQLASLPDWTSNAANGAWAASFYSELADRINAAGYHPLVGAIPAGEPALAGELGAGSPNAFQPIATAMLAKSYRWGWTYDAFSAALATSASQEASTSLRYRAIRDECGLANVPIVLREGGEASPGWQVQQTPKATYLAWLEWLDARLREDAEVVGVGLFQFGDATTLAGFDLDLLAPDLASWLSSASYPDAGQPAACGDAGCPSGADGGSSSSTTGQPKGSPNATPVTPHGCTTAGVAALPSLAGLLLIAMLRRRRR